MTLQTVESLRRRFRDKLLFQFLRRQAKRHVHCRTTIDVRVAAIKVSGVDDIIEQLRLCLILASHNSDAALLLKPFADKTENVDSPGVWRIVERLVLDVRAIVEHRRKSFRNALQQILTQDYDCKPAWSHVFLSAGVNDSILIHIDDARKNVRRSICNER